MEKTKFDYTANGYKEAVEYLKSVGEYERVSKCGLSTDGYSIVHEANSIFERQPQFIKQESEGNTIYHMVYNETKKP